MQEATEALAHPLTPRDVLAMCPAHQPGQAFLPGQPWDESMLMDQVPCRSRAGHAHQNGR